jgi:ferredoxin
MSPIERVEVDKQSCLSSGRCVEAAPAAFRFDADFLAEATPEAAVLAEERLEAIARACPGFAIHLRRGDDANPAR